MSLNRWFLWFAVADKCSPTPITGNPNMTSVPEDGVPPSFSRFASAPKKRCFAHFLSAQANGEKRAGSLGPPVIGVVISVQEDISNLSRLVLLMAKKLIISTKLSQNEAFLLVHFWRVQDNSVEIRAEICAEIRAR